MTPVQPPYDAAATAPDGDRYPQLLRTSRLRWWRPALGLGLAAVTVVGTAIVVILLSLLAAVLTGQPGDPRDASSLDADSPLGLLANNLVIVAIGPACLLAVRAVHRERAGWLWSVEGHLRWRPLTRSFGLALGVVAVFFAAGFALPPAGLGDIRVPQADRLTGLLAVILLTTPLQSAAEEVGFRGYLTQAIASWSARPIVGTTVAALVSATLFATAHGGQEPALFLDRFAFGLVASWLVWRTGGLEASIALHAANNLVSLGWTAATGSIEESLTASTLGWSYAVLDVAMMAVFAALIARLAQRWQLVVRGPAGRMAGLSLPGGAEPSALSGPGSVGYPERRSPTPPPAGREPPWGMG